MSIGPAADSGFRAWLSQRGLNPLRKLLGSVSGTRRNVLANIAGKVCSGFLMIVFVPFYLRRLGVEAWGLVGFQITLQGLLSLLELGLPATISRETARASARQDRQYTRDLLRTAELVLMVVAGGIALLIAFASPAIASGWLEARALPRPIVVLAVQLIGLNIAITLVSMTYSAGLAGLRHQVLLNGVTVSAALARALGSAAVILWISPTITAFLAWQTAVAAVQLVVSRYLLLGRAGGRKISGRWNPQVIRGVWVFASAMTLSNIIQTVAAYADKAFVSKLLPLEELGIYSLATTLAAPIFIFSGALSLAVYPVLCEAVAKHDDVRLRSIYLSAAGWTAAIIWPIAGFLSLFSGPVLEAWTRNPTLAERARLPTTLLVLAVSLGVLNQLTNQLQTALGRTRLFLLGSAGCTALFVPLAAYLVRTHGITGAAISQVLNVALFYLVVISVAHFRLMPGIHFVWWLRSFLRPIALAVGPLLISRVFYKRAILLMPPWLCLGLVLAVTFGIVVVVTYLIEHTSAWTRLEACISANGR